MGHSITAIIGTPTVVARVISAAGCPSATPLPFGLEIAPLGHQQIDALTALQPVEHFEGFRYLSAGLRAGLGRAVGEGVIVYVETDYFGGTGSQAAAVLSADEVAFQGTQTIGNTPTSRDDPINVALRAIGVVVDSQHDEFEALGLGRFRDLEDLALNEWDDD